MILWDEWLEKFKSDLARRPRPDRLKAPTKEDRERELQWGASDENLRWWIEQNRQDEMAGKWR